MTLRILYTIEERGTTVFGGAAKDLVWILKRLDRKQFTPAILLTGDDSFLRFLEQEKVNDVEIYRLSLPPWRKFKYRLIVPFVIRKLKRIIQEGRFDIVHVNSGYNDVPYVTRVARGIGSTSIFTVRNSDILGKKVKYYGYGKADCIIVCANEHGRILEEMGIKSTTIYSGVEESLAVDPFKKASIGIPEKATVIGTVANLMPYKGYPYLLEAMAKLVPKFQELWLVAVGGGDTKYEIELRSLAKQLSIADRVIFTGFQPSGRQWIPLFDLFVISSIRGEAATIAVLEAMAEGKPVVASAVGGIPELVEDGITGRLVPPESSEALTEAISALLSDREKAFQMGRSGKKRVKQMFSLQREVEKLQNLYIKMTKEKISK